MRRWQSFVRLAIALALVVLVTDSWDRARGAWQSIERPSALAAGDFDQDGVPDLLIGHASGGAGAVKLLRGVEGAIYSRNSATQSSEAEPESQPFRAADGVAPLPIAPDFIGAGDFDADGRLDAVAADRKSERLYLLRGDGRGGFAEAQAIAIPGQVTAMSIGEINRADGLADLIVGVNRAGESQLLIFEGPEGALRRAPEVFSLPSAANGFALGHFDDDGIGDLAVAAGERLLLIHGRDRRLSLDHDQQAAVPPAQVDERIFAARINAVAAGNFAGESQIDLALLMADGAAQLLEGQRDSSSDAGKSRAKPIDQWESREIYRPSSAQLPQPNSGKAPLLLGARLASSLHDQLVVADAGSRRLLILDGEPETNARLAVKHSTFGDRQAAIELSGEPLAVLPLRLNSDALSDLVILQSITQSDPQSGKPALIFARTAPRAVFTVTNANGSGPGSLAQAISNANSNPGLDQINFNIPGNPPFSISGEFPAITDAVVIDATTQPGYSGKPLVGLWGCSSPDRSGLNVAAGNSVIRGLSVQSCQAPNNFGPLGAGILLRDGGNNIVEGNHLGVNALGDCASYQFGDCVSGNRYGVAIYNSQNNTVGGTTAAARNVISGNRAVGVYIYNSTDNRIQGNYIGPDITGTKRIGSLGGIQVEADNNLIGGATAGAGNLVAAHNGVGANFGGNGNLVQGNLFGTSPAGQTGENNHNELNITAGSGNTIGGTVVSARNVFGGNLYLSRDATETLIQGNHIGADASGDNAVGGSGQIVIDGPSNTVGGVVAGARNILRNGVYIRFENAIGNRVQGNYIGVNSTGAVALNHLVSEAPSLHGVEIFDGVNNLIGGTTPAAGNLISGLPGSGVSVGGKGNRVLGNLIGTQADGVSPLGNRGYGATAAIGNVIGGVESGAGNVIAFNGRAGVAGKGVIRGNSIFSNVDLGIDLGDRGVSPNIPDENHNLEGRQNAPVITMAMIGAGGSTGLRLQGRLNSYANSNFTIDFYANPSCHLSGYGEGKTWLGSTAVKTGADFNATFNVMLPVNISAGQFITATATRENGTTSEFSPCVAVSSGCLSLYPVSFQLSGGRFLIPHAGGTGSIGVSGNCSWTATSAASWITINSGASGGGDGMVNFTAAANPGAAPRFGVINIGDQQAAIMQVGQVAAVSAASYLADDFNYRGIVAVFGDQMSRTTEAASSLPLPNSLAGTTAYLTAENTRETVRPPLFFVSPNQVNLLLNATAMWFGGPAKLTIVNSDGGVAYGQINIFGNGVTGGLFSADATGQGAAAGVALRVKADGSQQFEPIAQFDSAQNRFVPVPIDLGPEPDQVFLILFGTGVSYAYSALTAQVGGVAIDPTYIGPQGDFAGLDQINVPLPRTLIGRGEIDVKLSYSPRTSNVVRVSIK